jgi:hypothetical protein
MLTAPQQRRGPPQRRPPPPRSARPAPPRAPPGTREGRCAGYDAAPPPPRPPAISSTHPRSNLPPLPPHIADRPNSDRPPPPSPPRGTPAGHPPPTEHSDSITHRKFQLFYDSAPLSMTEAAPPTALPPLSFVGPPLRRRARGWPTKLVGYTAFLRSPCQSTSSSATRAQRTPRWHRELAGQAPPACVQVPRASRRHRKSRSRRRGPGHPG